MVDQFADEVVSDLDPDTTAPAAPVVSSVAASDPARPNYVSIVGTAEAGALVDIFDNGAKVGTLHANASGAFRGSATFPPGDHRITASAKDSSGNVSGLSEQEIGIVIAAPAPAVTPVVSDKPTPVDVEPPTPPSPGPTPPSGSVQDALDATRRELASGSLAPVASTDAPPSAVPPGSPAASVLDLIHKLQAAVAVHLRLVATVGVPMAGGVLTQLTASAQGLADQLTALNQLVSGNPGVIASVDDGHQLGFNASAATPPAQSPAQGQAEPVPAGRS